MQYHVVSELFTNNFSILFVETKQKKLEEREREKKERLRDLILNANERSFFVLFIPNCICLSLFYFEKFIYSLTCLCFDDY
jgi:hypothetical protein